jgi:hypothetical protein
MVKAAEPVFGARSSGGSGKARLHLLMFESQRDGAADLFEVA